MLVPASTGSGESDWESARLAEVLTVVSSVAVLSEVFLSSTSRVTIWPRDWCSDVCSSDLTTRVTDLLAPLVIVVRFHPTTPALRVPPPVAETKLVPAGIGSDGHTSVVQSRGLFVCGRVLVKLVPASTGSGESDLVSARLAEVLAVVSSVAVLSVVSFSNPRDVVLAVLESFPTRRSSDLTTRVTDLLAPLVIVVRFHPTTPAVRVPPPVAETKLVPAGIASDRLTPVASDGPLFVTVSV